MSDIPGCLSVFAVAAWANNEDGFRQAELALDSFSAGHRGDREADALRALLKAFDQMRLDSMVANQIRSAIEARILVIDPRDGGAAIEVAALNALEPNPAAGVQDDEREPREPTDADTHRGDPSDGARDARGGA